MAAKVTIIGAGKTGRGFLARLLQTSSVSIDFIDKNPELVQKLNEQGHFSISYFGGKAPSCVVSSYHAYRWDNAPEVADLIFVSVGASNLADVASSLKKKLRPSCRIIVCENAADPARILKNALGRDDIAVAESTVFCTTVEGEGLSIVSETYPYLQYNSDAFGKPVVPYPGFKPIPSFGNFLVRKIFTYNNASAVIAYLGALKGYQAYSEAANDPEILRLLDENYLATNEAMCRVYGYEKKDQEEFAALSKAKFTDPSIKDSIERNARDPLRKMGKEERIVGPLLLLWKEGLDSSVLEKTLAALLLYSDPKDLVWSKAQKEKSPADLLRLYSSLDPSETKVQRVLAYVQDPKSILAH